MSEARQRQLAVLVAVVVSLGLSAYIVSFPHWLHGIHGFHGTGYDDGVYTAAATSFIHGVLPYQDYVWVEPPGTVIFLVPLALLGRLIGTADMLAVGRVLTVLVAAANAGLAAWVVRSRGWLAMLIAGLTLACFPLAPVADHSMNMEPYFTFYVLLAAVVAFDANGALAQPRRLVAAGVLLGVATSFKVWGIALLVALLVCCWRKWGLALRAAVAYAATLILVSLPFLILSPRAFGHQAVLAQLRRSQPRTNLSVVHRLGMMLGLTDEHTFGRHDTVTLLIIAVAGALVVVVFGFGRRAVTRLDWFALAGAVLLAFGLLHASQFYDHYAYATAAMLAILAGVVISRVVGNELGAPRSNELGLPDLEESRPRLVPLAVAGVVVLGVLGGLAVPKAVDMTRATMAGTKVPNPAIDASIPKGACVVGDYPIVLVEANRWDPSSHCNPPVDPFGLWIQYQETEPPGHQPYPAKFVRAWQHFFNQAAAVVLLRFNDYLLPTSPQDPRLRRQLRSDFTQISSFTRQVIFKRHAGGQKATPNQTPGCSVCLGSQTNNSGKASP